MTIRKVLYLVVISIGFLQTIGYVTNIKPIRSLGVITCASPLPIVFTEVKGVETFASDFYMVWENENGTQEKRKITPEIYSKIKGPYNRRNVFGAAIAYGPILPKQVLNPILEYGICTGTLREELEIPFDEESFSIYIKTRTLNRDDEWTLQTNCKK